MKDRLVAGGLAGITGGIVQHIYGLLAVVTGISQRTFHEFAVVLIIRRAYSGVLGDITGIISHLSVTMLLGIAFAYVVKFTSPRYLLIKGAAYGFMLWVLLSGFGTIFNLPVFTEIRPQSTLSILVGSIIYGLVTAASLGFLEAKTKLL